jgi:prolipoprotein diacylglyceryltransferase
MTDADTGSLSKETGIRNTLKRYLGPDGVIMILLVLLSIVGIGITDFSPLLSHWYWLAMVVVIGIACIVMEWSRARKKSLNATTLIKKEVFIWLGVLVAVNLVYFLFHSGRLDSENTGLVILLILALATFLAGLRQDWRLCLLGVFLGGALILATYLEEYLWIVLMVVLAAAACVYFVARYKSAPEAEEQ